MCRILHGVTAQSNHCLAATAQTSDKSGKAVAWNQKWPKTAWMSQEVSKWLVNGFFHLLINGVFLGVITH